MYKSFFCVEEKYNLFDVKDRNNIHLWDVIRYDVYLQLSVGKYDFSKSSMFKRLSLIFKYIYAILISIYILVKNMKKTHLFIVNTRDTMNSMYYDKIIDDAIEVVGHDNCLVIETNIDNYFNRNYKYKRISCVRMDLLLQKFYRVNDVYFSEIVKIFSNEFPNKPLDIKEIKVFYKMFYSQYYFYKLLFKLSCIKKVYIVQNGIMKGLFKAASEAKVEVLEFQHGQISNSHMSYSYPSNIDITGKVYFPNGLLTFGKFWIDKVYMPGVNILSIGNNSFCTHIEDRIESRSVLVISGNVYGDYLKKFVKDTINHDIKYYFKLHPNEYNQVDNYNRYFNSFADVQVIMDEYSISELLERVDYVLAINSTVVFEALSCGRKVIILKKFNYCDLSMLFHEQGVYLVDTPDDFIGVFERSQSILLPRRVDFFETFNHDLFAKISKINYSAGL